MDTLTRADCDLILQSLEFTRQAFADYPHYPSYEFRCSRLEEVRVVAGKVSAMRKATS